MIRPTLRRLLNDRRRVANALGVLILVGLVAPFVVFAVPGSVGADHSFVVLSSSMRPAIDSGDVVLVSDVDPEIVEEGDVITYDPPLGSSEATADRVTHRVVEVLREDGQRRFRTKGDANEDPDQAPVPASNLIGRVSYTIPLLGHVILFAQSDAGLLSLVVVPAVLLVLSEVWDLVRAAGVVGATDEDEEGE